MADTELRIRISAQLEDAKAALTELTKQLGQIAQGSTQFGAVATAGFDRMEAAAERAAKASAEVATATQRMGEAIDRLAAKAREPIPVPKVPKAPLSEAVADQSAVQRAALKQQLADLEAAHKAGVTSEKAYYAQRASIQRAALQVEIAQARAAQAAATTQSARNAAATRQAVLTQRLSAVSSAVPVQKAKESADALGLAGLPDLLGKAQSAAAALGVTLTALAAVKTFVSFAEDAKNLEGRLRLATNSVDEYNTAQSKLFEIAQRTRSDLSQVVALYARLSTSTKTLGISQAQLLNATETVSKAIKLSFTGSAESANAALMQLGQGLAAGTLRGEELNSVLEQAPRLAQAIAAGMNVTTGELKRLGEEGKITAQNVLGALRSQAAAIDQEFKVLPRTIDGSMTALKNALVKGAGEIDRVGGFTASFAAAIDRLVPAVERASQALSEHYARLAADSSITTAQLTKDAGSLTDTIEESSNRVADTLSKASEKFGKFISDAIRGFNAQSQKGSAQIAVLEALETRRRALMERYTKEIDRISASGMSGAEREAASSRAWNAYLQQFEAIKQEAEKGRAAIETNFKALSKAGDDAVAKLRKRQAEAQALANQKPVEPMGPPAPPKPIVGVVDTREVAKEALRQQLEELERMQDQSLVEIEAYYRKRFAITKRGIDLEIAQQQRAYDKATTQEARDKAATDIAVLVQKRQAAIEAHARELEVARTGLLNEAELERHATEQSLKLLERKYERALISTRDYLNARAELTANGIGLEIEQEKKQLAKADTLEARKESLTKIRLLEQERLELFDDTNRQIVDKERELNEQLEALRVQQLRDEGRTVEARRAELIAQYADLRRRLEAEGNKEGLALVDRAIGEGAAKANVAQLGSDIDKTIARFRAAEQSAANAAQTGAATPAAASNAVRDAAAETIPVLERQRDALAATGDTSEETAAKLREVDNVLADLHTKAQGGLGRALANMSAELKNLRDSFTSDVAFAFRDNLKQLFDDIITGSKKGSEALRDFARNFARAILSMITQILATKAAQALLSRGAGLFGIFSGAIGGSTSAPVKHAGGVVGAGGAPMRTVPVAAFFGAPRLHTGGVLGLHPDEVPTILQRGEEVLSRNDPRNVRNQQNAGGPSTVQVVLHPDHNHRTMRDWLESELGRVAATT